MALPAQLLAQLVLLAPLVAETSGRGLRGVQNPFEAISEPKPIAVPVSLARSRAGLYVTGAGLDYEIDIDHTPRPLPSLWRLNSPFAPEEIAGLIGLGCVVFVCTIVVGCASWRVGCNLRRFREAPDKAVSSELSEASTRWSQARPRSRGYSICSPSSLPPDWCRRWKLNIPSARHGIQGMAMRYRGVNCLQVEQIKANSVMDQWNDLKPESSILPGDMIVEVNGCCDVEKMLKELAAARSSVLTVVRTSASDASVDAVSFAPRLRMRRWAMKVPPRAEAGNCQLWCEVAEDVVEKGTACLRVTGWGEDGYISKWNEKFNAKSVRLGDLLLEVRGSMDPEEMARTLARAPEGAFVIVLAREPGSEVSVDGETHPMLAVVLEFVMSNLSLNSLDLFPDLFKQLLSALCVCVAQQARVPPLLVEAAVAPRTQVCGMAIQCSSVSMAEAVRKRITEDTDLCQAINDDLKQFEHIDVFLIMSAESVLGAQNMKVNFMQEVPGEVFVSIGSGDQIFQNCSSSNSEGTSELTASQSVPWSCQVSRLLPGSVPDEIEDEHAFSCEPMVPVQVYRSSHPDMEVVASSELECGGLEGTEARKARRTFQAIALYDFDPVEMQWPYVELRPLALEAGQTVEVFDDQDGNWLCGFPIGMPEEEGYFPGAYIARVRPTSGGSHLSDISDPTVVSDAAKDRQSWGEPRETLKFMARYRFDPSMLDWPYPDLRPLPLEEGDIVEVFAGQEFDWVCGYPIGCPEEEGYFPLNFLESLEEFEDRQEAESYAGADAEDFKILQYADEEAASVAEGAEDSHTGIQDAASAPHGDAPASRSDEIELERYVESVVDQGQEKEGPLDDIAGFGTVVSDAIDAVLVEEPDGNGYIISEIHSCPVDLRSQGSPSEVYKNEQELANVGELHEELQHPIEHAPRDEQASEVATRIEGEQQEAHEGVMIEESLANFIVKHALVEQHLGDSSLIEGEQNDFLSEQRSSIMVEGEQNRCESCMGEGRGDENASSLKEGDLEHPLPISIAVVSTDPEIVLSSGSQLNELRGAAFASAAENETLVPTIPEQWSYTFALGDNRDEHLAHKEAQTVATINEDPGVDLLRAVIADASVDLEDRICIETLDEEAANITPRQLDPVDMDLPRQCADKGELSQRMESDNEGSSDIEELREQPATVVEHLRPHSAVKSERLLQLAQARLESAIAGDDIQELQAAIIAGEDAGLGAEELLLARESVNRNRRSRAIEALEAACALCQMDALRAAIREGEIAGLRSADLANARRTLAREEKLAPVRADLADAMVRRDIATLKRLVKVAEQNGVLGSELEMPRRILAEEQHKVAAKSGLRHAVRLHTLEALQAALADARAAGLFDVPDLPLEVKLAQKALALEQRRLEGRLLLKARVEDLGDIDFNEAHIIPVDAETRTNFLAAVVECSEAGLRVEELADARRRLIAICAATSDVSFLREAIHQAELGGMKYWEVAHAKRNFKRLERIGLARDTLSACCANMAGHHRELKAALAEAEAAGLPEAELAEARIQLEHKTRRDIAKDIEEVALGYLAPTGRKPTEDWDEEAALLRSALDTKKVGLPKLAGEIERAERAALAAEDILPIQTLVSNERFRRSTRQYLMKAKFTRKVGDLRLALDDAEACELHGWEVCHAKAALAAERCAAVQQRLREAAKRRDKLALKAVIAEAEAAGMEPIDLDDARQTLAEEERRDAALHQLAELRARKEVNPEIVQQVLQVAEEAWVDVDDLKDLRDFCHNEYLKSEARKHLAHSLRSSADSPKIHEIEAAIWEGERVGLDPEDFQEARDMIDTLRTRQMSLEGLRVARLDFKFFRDLGELKKVLKHAEDVGVQDTQLVSARALVAEEQKIWEVKLRLRQTAKNAFSKRYYIAEDDPSDRELQQLNIKAMEAAIDDAVLLGLLLTDPDLLETRTALSNLCQKEAKDLLADSLATRDFDGLHAALAYSEMWKLPAEEPLHKNGKAVFNVESRRRDILREVRECVGDENVEVARLRGALEEWREYNRNVVYNTAVHGSRSSQSSPDETVEEISYAEKFLAAQERKLTARVQLVAAVRGKDADAIQKALLAGVAAGLEEPELLFARQELAVILRRAASINLDAALRMRDIMTIQKAIEDGERCGLQPKRLEEARSSLGVLQRREAALEALTEALLSKEQTKLLRAAKLGEECGLNDHEVMRKVRCLITITMHLEQEDADARAALEKALAEDNLGHLRGAIKRAQHCQLKDSLVEVAQQRVNAKVQELLPRLAVKAM